MKVLFAIRDDNNIVDTIVRKYQRDYGKKIVYKEVNNFTAILRELQQNNNYDRIVISDDIDEKINKSENKSKLILAKLKSIRSVALKNILGKEYGITASRGTVIEKKQITYIPTWHPAALLRDETKKIDFINDLKLVLSVLNKIEK